MDVGALAKELGGGGHKNASGAKVNMKFIKDLYAGKL
jgi:nanoRNase/pAp phosphatase (c-di-AMP/oligoRNAs hydrolase)